MSDGALPEPERPLAMSDVVLVYAALALGIDLVPTFADMNPWLAEHRAKFDAVQVVRPDLWAALRDRTNRKRAELAKQPARA